MPKRTVRVNELLHREISEVLHTRYQAESVAITITSVNTAPDLRQAQVFYSVIGDEEKKRNARSLLSRIRSDLRQQVGRRIVLKYLPELHFREDRGLAEGSSLLALMDELEVHDEAEEPRRGD
ncbi:MAG: 30S ribosome-binding factor RbfA [Opitutales bacterium]|nr:30S ribosome-binding factor RbfA [Opitutales bacterium]MCH8539226.1 30S ribosome-binding factor RbfA [Opitutales bacterium]